MRCEFITLTTSLMFVCLMNEIASEPRWGWSARRRRRRASCKPANCVLGQWSHWSSCSHTCGPNGHSRRRRNIVKPAQCGGTCLVTTIGAKACNRFCLNSGMLIGSSCRCKDGYSGECCEKVTGGWTSWGKWCACSKTCGSGTQYRKRSCTKPGGTGCLGNSKEYRTCTLKSCKLDGGWSSWSRWGHCTGSCGSGLQTRKRSCTNPPPGYGGKKCSGPAEQHKNCLLHRCPDGGWSSWSSWGHCTGSCGSGLQTRKRSCTNPAPGYGGRKCSGPAEQHKNCLLNRCPVNGGWSRWGSWSKCSKTCGYGYQYSKRYCNNPTPKYGGKSCVGAHTKGRGCSVKRECPVNGGWSGWHPWGKCSKTCGNGHQFSHRYCNSPTPKYGGKQCVGLNKKTRSCSVKSCAVNGGWSTWGKWCACSKTCGTGSQYRKRSCTKPPAAYGGKPCEGQEKQTRICNTRPCPVHGGWSNWAKWGACTKTCGNGKQYSKRYCNNPTPKYGGKKCYGNNVRTRNCRIKLCPVDGRWSKWAAWSKCSKTCGSYGKLTRHRTCTNPPPKNGGTCKGPSTQTKSCHIKKCPVNGGWGTWGKWQPCSKRCGTGTQHRSRFCNRPSPAHGGKHCSGLNKETRKCNTKPCPVDGRWSLWARWSACSKTCGTGSQTRKRFCTNPPPLHGGQSCKGPGEQTKSCSLVNKCPTDGGWSTWGKWCACSKTCGTGSQYRKRSCTSPSPAQGGKQCPGENKETRKCNTKHCPAYSGWGSWGAWSACSKTCGSGSQNRKRTCLGHAKCPGSHEETRHCNTEKCPVVNGGWGAWSDWSACSVSCGPGTSIRTRKCDNPPPGPGGSSCVGLPVANKPCDLGPCAGNCWSDWSDWSKCTKACGCGRQFRVRYCKCAHGQGQNQCQGLGESSQSCNCNACPNGPPFDAAIKG